MQSLTVQDALSIIQTTVALDGDQYEAVLSTLESYECWTDWFRVAKHHATTVPKSFSDDHCRIARIHLKYFEDSHQAGECCVAIIEATGMSYTQFCQTILNKIITDDDYASEGQILKLLVDKFTSAQDRIAVLERLCFIFEKKHHNDVLLNQFYDKLLKIHPENPKALRFFRTLHTQMQDWPAVAKVLRILLNCAKHPQEGYRHAQELAAVELYHLDHPQEAIRIIEEYCANSTLDTSTIHYEAYYRLGNLEGCLKVLRSCLLTVEDDMTRSIVHYRIASLFEQLGQLQTAQENYEKAYKLNGNFLETLEGLISSSIKLKQWTRVIDWISVLASKVHSESIAAQLNAGKQRLMEGIQGAQTS
jgi:tetratricopeptide (TPR) repeat protein